MIFDLNKQTNGARNVCTETKALNLSFWGCTRTNNPITACDPIKASSNIFWERHETQAWDPCNPCNMLIGGMPIKQNFLTNSEGLIGACSMPLAATPAPAAAPVTARRLGCAGLPCDWLRRSPLAALAAPACPATGCAGLPCACPRSPLLGLDGNVFGSVRT